MSEEIKLLPCPFCGGTDIRIGHDVVYGRYYAVCPACMAKGPRKMGWEERAANAWNAAPRSLVQDKEPPNIPGKCWTRNIQNPNEDNMVKLSPSRIDIEPKAEEPCQK